MNQTPKFDHELEGLAMTGGAVGGTIGGLDRKSVV